MSMKYIVNNLYICIVSPAKNLHTFLYSDVTKSMNEEVMKIGILRSGLKKIINICVGRCVFGFFLWKENLCNYRLFIALFFFWQYAYISG